MTVLASDISLNLSGGTTNVNPQTSLGGNPSNQPVVGVVNNIYDNVSPDDAEVGLIDYRCIYLFNNNGSDNFYNVNVFTLSEVLGGASVRIGTDVRTDIQQITVDGSVSGGSFELTYTGSSGANPVTVPYASDDAVWAQNVEDALNSLDDLSGVSVDGIPGVSSRAFVVNFLGNDDNRFHELLDETSNDLTGGASTITITKIQNGSPINAIAPEIAFDTTPPVGVSFVASDEGSPVVIGNVLAGDGVPIWFERTTSPDTDAVEGDGFTMRIAGDPVI